MKKILKYDSKDFSSNINYFLSKNRGVNADITDEVKIIIDSIIDKGDKALNDLTLKYDDFDILKYGILVEEDEINIAFKQCKKELVSALEEAAERVGNFHKKQLPININYKDDSNVQLSYKWTPLDSVGLYVPGGKASYPSSVIMTAIPAKIAKVSEVSMCVPSPKGYLNPSVLVAAKICGVSKIYKIGGAQAIAAMTYGTKSVKKVNKIFGPGNAWVAEAKRQLFGKVGIDMLAGPSEILVISDSKSNPNWIAADLMSQAEHDVESQSILITDSLDFAIKVESKVNSLIETLERKKIVKASWNNNGIIIVLKNLQQSIDLVNKIAPEHLEISTENPKIIAEKINNAGSIFLGRFVPEAVGDYIAGPNHVLPTGSTAKFSSGISTIDYMRRTSLIDCDYDALLKIAPSAIKIAENEGLEAHALSMKIRMNNKNEK